MLFLLKERNSVDILKEIQALISIGICKSFSRKPFLMKIEATITKVEFTKGTIKTKRSGDRP